MLHVSGLACRAGWHWVMPSDAVRCLRWAGQITAVHKQQFLEAASSNSRLHGAKKGAACMVPWVVLMDRALLVLSEELRDLAALSTQHDDQGRVLSPDTTGRLQRMLQGTSEGINRLQQLLGANDPSECISIATMAAACLTELQDQAAAVLNLVASAQIGLQRQLDCRATLTCSSKTLRVVITPETGELAALAAVLMLVMPDSKLTDSEEVHLMTAAIGNKLPQQLMDLGAAVCAALLVSHCCNNPWGLSAAKLTQLCSCSVKCTWLPIGGKENVFKMSGDQILWQNLSSCTLETAQT